MEFIHSEGGRQHRHLLDLALECATVCNRVCLHVIDGVTAVFDEVIERGIVDGGMVACGGTPMAPS